MKAVRNRGERGLKNKEIFDSERPEYGYHIESNKTVNKYVFNKLFSIICRLGSTKF